MVRVREVRQIHAERAVRLQVQEFVQDELPIDRLAVRSQPHELVLAAVHPEAGEVRERGVEQAERVRKAQLLPHAQLVAAANRDAPGRPLSHAVERHYGRLVEGRREERAGRVRLVVLQEDVAARVAAAERPIELPWGIELLLEPERQSHEEQLEAAGREGRVGLEDAVKLEQRLVVERDEVEFFGADPAFRKAVVDRMAREARVVLPATEALFLCRRDDLPVNHQASSAVVVVRGDT